MKHFVRYNKVANKLEAFSGRTRPKGNGWKQLSLNECCEVSCSGGASCSEFTEFTSLEGLKGVGNINQIYLSLDGTIRIRLLELPPFDTQEELCAYVNGLFGGIVVMTFSEDDDKYYLNVCSEWLNTYYPDFETSIFVVSDD